jgi:hypothetical protein
LVDNVTSFLLSLLLALNLEYSLVDGNLKFLLSETSNCNRYDSSVVLAVDDVIRRVRGLLVGNLLQLFEQRRPSDSPAVNAWEEVCDGDNLWYRLFPHIDWVLVRVWVTYIRLWFVWIRVLSLFPVVVIFVLVVTHVVSLDDNCASVIVTARSTVFDRTPDWHV